MLQDVRRLWVDLDDADYIREQLNLPGCRIALRVDRELRDRQGVVISRDDRYFICSLDPGAVTAEDLLRYQPVEKGHPGRFQPRQVRSKAPHGSQNSDLRRHFGITSM